MYTTRPILSATIAFPQQHMNRTTAVMLISLYINSTKLFTSYYKHTKPTASQISNGYSSITPWHIGACIFVSHPATPYN